ncbi:hypothetical protein K1719_024173 [Acacia pycnantha]|nr:hypothetical protein K1719_024173 [Acacia pycnantha]
MTSPKTLLIDDDAFVIIAFRKFRYVSVQANRYLTLLSGSDASAFYGSSPGENHSYQLAAIQLAEQPVERKIDFVYGGTSPISFKTIPFCKPSQSISPIAMESPVVPWLLWPTLTEPRSNGLIYATQCSSPVMGCFI